MTFLIDTNVLSELRRPERADRNVVAWFSDRHPTTLYTSAVVVMELQFGALHMQRRDPVQGQPLLDWVAHRVLRDFASRILPMSTDVALACAALHVPNPRSERDAWIAATALVHDLTVVTRNTRDFESTGVRVLNPWLQA